MARFCKFRGKAGVLVAHPLALDADPPRYAGQVRLNLSAEALDAAKGIDDRRHSERYEPCDDVLPLDWHLEKAAQMGDGVIVARCDAKNMADAKAAHEKDMEDGNGTFSKQDADEPSQTSADDRGDD